jgi:hypothetical protein
MISPFLEDHAILIAEHREKHAALEVGPTSIPVDVQIGGEWRILTPFEHIQPPGQALSFPPTLIWFGTKSRIRPIPFACSASISDWKSA